MAESMHCDPSIIDSVGVTVMGSPSRAESHVTAGYKLGEHLVVTCDPAVEDTLRPAAAGVEPSLDGWRALAESLSGELLGAGRMQLLEQPVSGEPSLAPGYTLCVATSDDPEVVELLGRFIEECDEEELDDAELYLDELDDVVHLALGPDGAIAAYASGHPFEMAQAFSDIGVITHADHRSRGLGAAVVSSLCAQLLADGIEPLYRCDEDNAGSVRLSASLGFAPTTQLVAYRFAT